MPNGHRLSIGEKCLMHESYNINMKAKSNLNSENQLSGSLKNKNGNLSKETLLDNDPLKVYYDLEEECQNNCDFFKNDTSEKGKRFQNIFIEWVENVKKCKESVKKINLFMDKYDFDENTPGNGYRSFVRVAEACSFHGLRIAKNLTSSRGKILFRKGYYLKEVESCCALHASLNTCLDYLFILRESSSDGDLFANYNVETLFEKGEEINQHSFYGRCLGFQYRKTIQGALRFISITMAGFSESYYSSGGRIARTTSSVWTGGKYFLNPELRAKRIVNISQNATIDFCKSFWFLAESELMLAIPTIVGSAVKINRVIIINPEPIEIESEKESGKFIDIPIPTIHLGLKPVSARLLCTERYKKMTGNESKGKALDLSDNLLFHCHGGGFVAQSSKSHELYLRDWAAHLKAPILSIDYSLAPEAPFPRALDEVFYVYCWAIKNAETIGWSGKNIVVAGDSAGANLVLGVTLKCVQMEIRKPNGIFLSYCPTLINFTPSPARLLCLMDPILPFGFMMRCLKAYTCSNLKYSDNKCTIDVSNELSRSNGNNITNSVNLSSVDKKLHNNHTHGEGTISQISDATSDTFASASLNDEKYNENVEKTELSQGDISSCTSFEDDSQPITHMPVDSTTSGSKSNEKLNESEDCADSLIQKVVEVKSLELDKKSNSDNEKLKDKKENSSCTRHSREITSADSIQSKFTSAVSSISITLNKFISSNEIEIPRKENKNVKKIDALIAQNDEFVFEVPKDPFLSPYYTAEEHLIQYPKVKILTVDMDPCLDDCVMFAKKLKKLNADVSLEIIQGLPHGFLNFTMMSSEAMEGSKICVSHIAELFESCKQEAHCS